MGEKRYLSSDLAKVIAHLKETNFHDAIDEIDDIIITAGPTAYFIWPYRDDEASTFFNDLMDMRKHIDYRNYGRALVLAEKTHKEVLLCEQIKERKTE